MNFQYSGLFGFLVLIAGIYAILNIVQSRATNGSKAVWIAVVLFLPLLGFIIWWLAGPKNGEA